MRALTRFILTSLCLMFLLAVWPPAPGAGNIHIEDFSSKQYCDVGNTTALWDTTAGEIRLHPYQITREGHCYTYGMASAVAVSGDYAYITETDGNLKTVDISDPANPTVVGTVGLASDGYGVAVSGNYAYVAAYQAGLVVVDITTPSGPTPVAEYDPPGSAQDVAIAGDYAYVASWGSGLQVVNISDPTSPTYAGGYDTDGSSADVAVSGDYAYIADGSGGGLTIVSISDPTNPTYVGGYNTPSSGLGIVVSDKYAYLCDGTSLQVIDVSNPAAPSPAGSYGPFGLAVGVALAGDILYVADYSGFNITALDITDPTNPTHLATYDSYGYPEEIALHGEYACVADGPYFTMLNIAERTAPSFVDSVQTSSETLGAAIEGDYAYVADGENGLLVMDISNPASPSVMASCDTPGIAEGVALSGTYAYVADNNSGLQVIDISNPANPMRVASYDTPGKAHDVIIAGDFAYVADDSAGGMQVIDISVPTSPVYVDSSDSYGALYDLAISGDNAYAANGWDGLWEIGIRNPYNVGGSGPYWTPGPAYGVAVSGDYAYVACGSAGLAVMDISNPDAPAYAGVYNTSHSAHDVVIDGDYAYVADYSSVTILDVSNPTAPTYVDKYSVPAHAWNMTICGDYVYLASGIYGLHVVQVLQRRFDADNSAVRSLTLNDMSGEILGARLTASQSGSIQWQLSADGGSSWQEFSPDDTWDSFLTPGSDLIWMSTHHHEPSLPSVNPTCTNLEIEWLYGFPVIEAVLDIPNDQGRWVRLSWARSGHDVPGGPTPITEYAVFRRVDEIQESAALGSGRRSGDMSRQELGEQSEGPVAYPPGDWDFVVTVPADCEDSYSTVVPTLADSTVSAGMHYTVFFVRARTSTPGTYFDAPPDSGYSLDNLAPSAPSGLHMPAPTELSWSECPDEDFDYFSVYGSGSPAHDSAAVLIGCTVESAMDITSHGYGYYHVTATDFAGNEGEASSIDNPSAGVPGAEDTPASYALKQISPNPFAATTSIAFDLPTPAQISLKILDVEGRLVRTVGQGLWPAGSHSVTWSGLGENGSPVGAGVYFVRMETAGFKAAKKVLLMR